MKTVPPLVKWSGGKGRPKLHNWIIGHLPPHGVYCEPFCGGLNVLLNKAPSAVEVANDANPWLVEMYRVFQSGPEELRRTLLGLPYDGKVLVRSDDWRKDEDPIVRACSMVVGHRWSFAGGGGRSISNAERQRGGRGGDFNSWDNVLRAPLAPDGRPAAGRRLPLPAGDPGYQGIRRS